MSPLHLVAPSPAAEITEDEARERLHALDPKAIKAARLAREWGWSRWKARQFVAACRAEGVIPPIPAGSEPKRKAAPVDAPDPSPAIDVEATPQASTQEEEDTHMSRTEEIHPDSVPPFESVTNIPDEPEEGAGPPWRQRDDPPPHVPPSGRMLGLILGTAAIALGGVGLVLNITFGRSGLAAVLLAVLGGVIDVMTIVLPTVAGNLWEQKRIAPSVAAWLCWCGMLIMTLIAASGFAATNIGDTGQNRANIANQRTALTARLDRLRHDRDAILETRATAAIAAAIQQEQSRIPADRVSGGCTGSGKVCAKIATLRQAKATAERRDALDAEIKEAEATLNALPAYVSADPGADMAAKLLTDASLGAVKVTPEAIQKVRIAGLTAAPALSGLLLLFAGLCWRPRREAFIPSLV